MLYPANQAASFSSACVSYYLIIPVTLAPLCFASNSADVFLNTPI